MLSVMERMNVVAEAESIASERRFRDLVEHLENYPSEFVRSDPTLSYLLAYGNYMIGRETQAQSQLKRLANCVSNVNDRLCRRVLNLRAIIDIELGNLADATRLLTKVQALSELARDHRYIGYSTLNRGIVLDMMGYTAQAITALQRARLSFQRLGDLTAVAGCSHNLGMCFRRIHCFDTAESEFAAATDHFTKYGSKEEATATLLERALTLSVSGESEIGYSAATRALVDAEVLQNVRLQAEAQRVVGCIAAHRGDYSTAIRLLDKALARATEGGLRVLQAEVLVELARVALIEDRQEEGAGMLARASKLFAGMGAVRRACDIQRILDAQKG